MKIKLEKKIDLFALIRAIIYVISIILVVLVQIGIIKTSCFWYDNYGILCPSCGLTRATKSIIQLKFSEAFQYNAVYTCALLPFLIILLINDFHTLFQRYVLKRHNISYIEIILGYLKDE